MESLAITAGVILLVIFAVWWVGRKRSPDADELPWEAKAGRRQTSSPAEEEEATPPPPPPPPPPQEDAIPEALRASARKLRSDVPLVVQRGAEELGRSDHPDAAGLLIRALGNEQRSVLFAVFEALVALRAHSAGQLRLAADTHAEPAVRCRAGLVLGQIERLDRGEPPASVGDLLALSDRQREEMARDLDRG